MRAVIKEIRIERVEDLIPLLSDQPYRPDLDRRTPGIMDEADLWLQWVQMRADWLETRWGDNN